MGVRGFVLITGGAAVLMGCSAERRSADTGTANINAAAAAAQGDIDTYAAGTLQAVPPASSTPSPKAAPVTPQVKSVARPDPTPSPEPAAATNRPAAARQVATTDGTDTGRCAGQTRVSARADDSEFERAARDAPAQQRPAGAIWQKGDGQNVRAGRDALESVVPAGCTTN